MTDDTGAHGVQKLKTGISGFDEISEGGLPRGRTTLLSGTAGSGKSTFATQFVVEGIQRHGQHGVLILVEESPEDLAANMKGFGWDLAEMQRQGQLVLIDASADNQADRLEVGHYDLGGLIARIKYAAEKVGAKRLALDSLDALVAQFADPATVRREMLRVIEAFRAQGLTAVLTAGRTSEYGSASRFGVEDFVADNVLVLRNALEQEKRRRTVEVLKFRGTRHCEGEFPFTILPDRGIVVIPLGMSQLQQRSSTARISSGVAELDEMCGGGFFRDSIILISGPTGTGKTLLATQFMKGGVEAGDRSIVFSFEESHDQLRRNAAAWGVDYQHMEEQGLLQCRCVYPEVRGLADHLLWIQTAVDEFGPKRVAIDSLSALERIASPRAFREFLIGLTCYIKEKQVAGLFTATTASLFGGASIMETHVSTITDAIILLRYVEMYGEMRRSLNVLKMRGSKHDKAVREFVITESGASLGAPFRYVSGILAGQPIHADSSDIPRIDKQFE